MYIYIYIYILSLGIYSNPKTLIGSRSRKMYILNSFFDQQILARYGSYPRTSRMPKVHEMFCVYLVYLSISDMFSVLQIFFFWVFGIIDILLLGFRYYRYFFLGLIFQLNFQVKFQIFKKFGIQLNFQVFLVSWVISQEVFQIFSRYLNIFWVFVGFSNIFQVSDHF